MSGRTYVEPQRPRWSELASDRYLAGTEKDRAENFRRAGQYALAHYAGWGLPGFAALGPVLASPALAAAVRAYADMERATRGLYGMDVTEFVRMISSTSLTEVGQALRPVRSRSRRLPHPPVKATGRHGSRVQRARHRNPRRSIPS